MTKLPKIVAIVNIAAGALMVVLGVASYYLVQRELSDEHIVVSDDAETMAGKDVEGPLTAYSQAMVIKERTRRDRRRQDVRRNCRRTTRHATP